MNGNDTSTSRTVELYTDRDGPYAVIQMTAIVNTDPDTVWGIVGDWKLEQMATGFETRCEISGRGVGDTRRISLGDEVGGGSLYELLTELDPIRRSYSYVFLDSGPLPWVDYKGRIHVMGHGGSRSIIFYEVRFIPVGQGHAEAMQLSIANNRPWVEDVQQRFQHGGPTR